MSTTTVSTTSSYIVSQQVESHAVESAAGAALLQLTNETDAVRAIAATAAKTNFFIIFFFAFNLLNVQFAFKTDANLRTFEIPFLIKRFFFSYLAKKSGDKRNIKQFIGKYTNLYACDSKKERKRNKRKFKALFVTHIRSDITSFHPHKVGHNIVGYKKPLAREAEDIARENQATRCDVACGVFQTIVLVGYTKQALNL